MNRRGFLGAAAALGTLPATTSGEVKADDDAPTAATERVATREAHASVDLPNEFGEADLSVQGEWLDDEPGHVTLSFSLDVASVQVSVDGDEARAFAAEIEEAARFAEEGPDR
jgi:hypothetical protein